MKLNILKIFPQKLASEIDATTGQVESLRQYRLIVAWKFYNRDIFCKTNSILIFIWEMLGTKDRSYTECCVIFKHIGYIGW